MLPTQIESLPDGLSASPDSVSCRAATVRGGRAGRYSLLVSMNGFLNAPPKSLPLQYITLGVRIHTATHAYTTYLQDQDEISYEPPRVRVNVDAISEKIGGFGFSGVFTPFPTRVSKKLLLAGRNNNVDHDPATTLTLNEEPTSCDVVVNGGYQRGQTIEIPLVP